MELTMSSKSHIRVEGTEIENDLMHFNIDISEEVRYHHHHQHKKDAERALDSNGKSRNPGGGLENRIKENAMSFGEPNKFYAESHDIGQSDHTRHTLGRDRHKEYTKSRKHFHHRTYKIARNLEEESPEGNATWCKAPTLEFNSSEMAYERYYPPQLQPRREAIREPGYEPDFRPPYPQETNKLRAQAYAGPGYAYAHEYYPNVPKQYHESHCPPQPQTEHLSYAKITPVGPRTSASYREFNPYSEAPSHDVFSGEYLVSSTSIPTSIPVYRPPWEPRTRIQVKGAVPPEYPLNYNSPCYYSSNSYHDFRKCGKIYGNSDPHVPACTPREFSGYDYYDARHAPRTHPPGKPSPKSTSKYYDTYDNPSIQHNTYTDDQGPIKISHKYYTGEADAEDECENVPIKQFDRYKNNSEAMLEQCDSFNYKKKNSSPRKGKNHDKDCQESPKRIDKFFKEEIPYRKPHYNERKKHQLRREPPSKQYHYFADIPQRLKYAPDYIPNHQESKIIAKSAELVKFKDYGGGLEVPHKICKYQMTESPIVHFSPVEIPYRRRERIHLSPHKNKSAHKSLDAGCDTITALSGSELTVNNGSHHSVGPQSRAFNKYSHDDRRHPHRKAFKDRISGLVKKSKLSITRSNLFKRKSLVLKGYKPANCFNFTSMSTKNERKIQEERSFSGAEHNFMRRPNEFPCRYPTGYRGQGQEDDGRKYQEYSMFNVLNSSERSKVISAQNEHGHTKYSESCRASDSSLDECSICDKYKIKSSCSDSGSGNSDDNSCENFSNSCSYNCGDNCGDNCSDNCSDTIRDKCTYNCCTNCKCDDNGFKATCDPVKPSQINICLTIRTVDANLVDQPRVTSSESKCHCLCKSTAACRENSQPTCQVRVCEPPSPTQSCLKSASSKCQKGCASKAHRDEPRGGCGENSFKNVRPNRSSQNQSASCPSKGHKKKASVNTSCCPLNKTCPPGNMEGKCSRPSRKGCPRNSCAVGTAIQKQDKSPCVQRLRPTIRPCSEAQARSMRRRVVLNTNSDSTLVDSDKSESKRAKGCTRCTSLKSASPTNPSKGSCSGRNTRSNCTAKGKHKNSTTSLSSFSSRKSSSSCEKKPKQSPEEYVCYPNPHLGDNTCPGGNFSMLASYNTPGPVQRGDLCCPKLVAEWDQECCHRKNPIEDLKQELLKNMRSEQQLDAQAGALRLPPHMMFLPCVPDAPCQQNACPFACWSPDPVVSWPPCPTLQAPCPTPQAPCPF